MPETTDPVDRLARLEARLRVLEDEREIRELLARYGHLADAGLDEEFIALFTEDGVMDVSAGGTENPYRVLTWEGLPALREFLGVRTAQQGDGFVGASLHVQGNNLTIDLLGDDATAIGYSFIVRQVDGTPVLTGASINSWALRRTAAGWRVARRTRRLVGAPDTVAILKGGQS